MIATRMPRRERQLDELRRMCDAGALERAIDLAFAHFGDFGANDEVLTLLAAAVDRSGPLPHVLRRLAELRTLCSK